MDNIDSRLLNIIQSDFPISPRPFEVLGNALGITEREALERTRAFVDSGVIRRIGPSFNTRKLGYASTLVAAKVPPERLEEVANIVSSFDEVTHNYGRDFAYNLWFTLICHGEAQIESTLERIKSATGVTQMLSLPAEKMFKIKVEFEF